MATAEQCDCHGDCGFVAFRRNAKWPAIPLPENDDFGIDIPINHFGPKFDNEASFIDF